MAYELQHRTDKSYTKGAHFPLGASLTREGVNFAVYSQHAAEVFLLLFNAHDGEPSARRSRCTKPFEPACAEPPPSLEGGS